MKEVVLASGRWIVVGALLLALGLLIMTGLGRKRGTRLYRARIDLWSVILGLAAAGGVLVGSSTLSGCRTCYKPMPDEPGRTVTENEGTDEETTVTVETTEVKEEGGGAGEDESTQDGGSGKEDGAAEDGKQPPPPVVPPTCYSAPPPPPPTDQPPPTCYKPMMPSTPTPK